MTRTQITLALALLTLTAGLTAAAPKEYPFTVSPDKAFDRLAGLEKASGQKRSITEAEARLFADVRDGKLDEFSFAEACLIASGVTDAGARKKYVAEIDRIEADARKAVEAAKTPAEKGEKLLKFLHAGPMAKGYESKQTDLHTILDTGHFNCVSSAVLYNVIGRRLGLDLKAVEIPEHVFSVLCDGDKRIDIETTNALGFDPSDDQPSGAKKSTKAQRHANNRREVGETGLASIIAYNHGVGLSQEKKFHESILENFRALALDPTNPSAMKNAIADLTNWPLELSKESKYEEALSTLAIGLDLAPKTSALKNNHKVLWNEYAEWRMKNGKAEEALIILRRAAKADTGEDFDTRQAYLFAKPAHAKMDAGEWDEALKIIDNGLKLVDAKAKKKLREQRVGVFLNWASKEQDDGRFESALTVLKRAAAEEKDSRIKNNTLAVYDAWANGHMSKGEWAKAIEIYEMGLKHLPGDPHLKGNLAYCRQESKK